jgi:hypothetical protein
MDAPRLAEDADPVVAALVADVGVALGGADVGVPGEVFDDLERDVALGEQGAEGVAQRVRMMMAGRELRLAGMAGDDLVRPAGREVPGRLAARAGRAQQKDVGLACGARLMPREDGGEGLARERHAPGTAATASRRPSVLGRVGEVVDLECDGFSDA